MVGKKRDAELYAKTREMLRCVEDGENLVEAAVERLLILALVMPYLGVDDEVHLVLFASNVISGTRIVLI